MQKSDSEENSLHSRRARRWRFSTAEFDGARQLLLLAGSPVAIEPKPLQLLEMLLEQAGEVLTKRELIEALWPGRVVTDGVLTNAVNKLRAALGDEPPQIVRTVHGHGYKLAVPVAVETLEQQAVPNLRLSAGLSPPQRPLWRLTQRLGRGGQGEAWLAEHSRTRERRVFKFALDEAALSSLKREVTIFRLLSQDAGMAAFLLRLIDWNFTDRPYFIESEWQVQGNLHEWSQTPGRMAAMPLSARLGLIAGLADLVARAHGLGVLHKDLKPSNLFVSSDAVGELHLRIADWGAGQVTDEALLTQAGITHLGLTHADGNSAGTPGYQAPETLTGAPATARGDIYALGVLLYQMAVGDLRRPLAPGWEQDISDPLLREDIALAVHGKVEQRLSDAAQLAQRLRMLDQRREAQAAQDVQSAQLARQIEQQRLALAQAKARRGVLQLLLAVASTAMVVIGVLYWRAEEARLRSTQDAETAEAVTRFLTQDLIAGGNPFVQGRGDVTVRQMLDASARSLPQRLSDPAARAATQLALGSAYAGIGDRGRAEQHLDAALAYWRETGSDSEPPAQAARAALAELYAAQRNMPALEQMAHAIIETESRAHVPSPALALRAQLALDYVACFGPLYRKPACVEKLEMLHQRALNELGAAHADSARIALTLAGVLANAGDTQRGLELGRQALEAWGKAVGPNDALLLSRSQDYGNLLVSAGRAAQGLAQFDAIRARVVAIYGEEHAEVQLIDTNRVRALLALGEYTQAMTLARSLHAQRSRQFGERDIYARALQGHIAEALLGLGQVAAAREILRNLLKLDEATEGVQGGLTSSHRRLLERSEKAARDMR